MNPITEKQYYQETDKEKRKKILEAAIEAEGMNPEDELRLELWERRYGRREKEPEGIDRYIRGWNGLSESVFYDFFGEAKSCQRNP